MPKLPTKQVPRMKLRRRSGPAHHKYNLRSRNRKPPEHCTLCGEHPLSKHENCKSEQKKPVRKRPARCQIKLPPTPCVICLDTSKFKQIRKVKCGHEFHVKCINSWLKHSDSCPVCRFQLRKPSFNVVQRFILGGSIAIHFL